MNEVCGACQLRVGVEKTEMSIMGANKHTHEARDIGG